MSIAGRGKEALGLRAEELRAYGLDPAALSALASGEEVGVRLADRLDVRGLELLGLGELTEFAAEGMLDAAGAEGVIEQEIGRYDYRMGRAVIDGLTLFGSEVAVEDEDEADQALLRRFAVIARSYSIERMVAFDSEAAFSMMMQTMPQLSDGATDGEDAPSAADTQETSGTFRSAVSGVAGYDRGDIALNFARGTTMTMNAADASGMDLDYDFTMALTLVRDMRLADVLAYAARAEFPPSQETDLMSLGLWEVDDFTVSMMGQPFQTIDRYRLDLTEWHGLMPERIAFESEEVLHLAGFMAIMEQAASAEAALPRSPDEERAVAELQEGVEAVKAVLAETGLESIRSDNEMLYVWAPGDGEAALSASSVLAELGGYRLEAAGRLPSYDGFATIELAAPADGGDELAALLAEQSKIGRFVLTLSDEGGIDRMLDAVIAFADLPQNDGNPQMAMVRGQDPAALRAMMSMGASVASAQFAAIAPEAQGMAQAASAWLREGGTLTIAMEPEAPLGAEDFDRIAGDPEGPSGVIRAAGLSVSHEGGEE